MIVWLVDKKDRWMEFYRVENVVQLGRSGTPMYFSVCFFPGECNDRFF